MSVLIDLVLKANTVNEEDSERENLIISSSSGLETATAPSSESGNPTLSPEAVTVSMSPVPFSNSSRIAGTGAGRRSKIHVLDVD